jgi:hypothetical protein
VCYNILEIENAGMAELADAQDLGDVTSVKVLPFHSSPAPPKLNMRL